MALVTDRLPAPTAAAERRALQTALRHTARHGITGLRDAGVSRSAIRRFRRSIEADRFPLRVYAMILGQDETFDFFCEHGPLHHPPLHHPSGQLDVVSAKLFADGALGSRGAALLADYADAPGPRGTLRHAPEALLRHVRTATRHGLQVCTHAIGDRTARAVLDAYAAGMEQAIGSIPPGKRAAWIVLSHDPMTVPTAALPDIEVVGTYLGGRRIYPRDESGPLGL